MSLKAKMEAVIYASEEPVTLVQLVGLLGLEGQAELDRLDARQQRLHLAADDGLDLSEGSGAVDVAEVELGLAEPAEAGEIADGVESPAEKKAGKERERRLREYFRGLLDELIREFQTGDRGLEVREVAGGFRMATKPEYHDAVRGFVKSLKPVMKLTLQALETLAVVAYKQPVTAPEVSEIRGVDSGGVLGSLLGRKLVTTAGRKQVIGRPILYKTTKDFLLRFGLKDISELPSIEEFEKMAGELAEQEEIEMSETEQASGYSGRLAEQEEIEMSETQAGEVTAANLEEEKDAVEPQADGDERGLDAGDLPTLDGRESGLPPQYDDVDNPSAEDAAIQGGE